METLKAFVREKEFCVGCSKDITFLGTVYVGKSIVRVGEKSTDTFCVSCYHKSWCQNEEEGCSKFHS